MPPQNFSGLTEEELKAMEGNERANVEARIKCLKNIQVLLDAAVMEMQQYSSVVSQLDTVTSRSRANFTNATASVRPPPASAASPATADSSSTEEPTVVVTSLNNSDETTSTTGPEDTTANKPLLLPTAETGARPKVKSQQDNQAKKEDIDDSGDKSTDDQDEVRKRRLERFGSSPAANSE